MRAPSFSLLDQDGRLVALQDFAGRHLIIFFYPAAMTPGCTIEAGDFRDSYESLLSAGFEVVGVSPDPPTRNAEFRAAGGLPFDLLSDPDHATSSAYGAWGTKKSYGREYEGLIRSTFVVGPGGDIERTYGNVKAKGHVARVTADLLG